MALEFIQCGLCGHIQAAAEWDRCDDMLWCHGCESVLHVSIAPTVDLRAALVDDYS